MKNKVLKFKLWVMTVILIIFPFTTKLVHASVGNDARSYVTAEVTTENKAVSNGQYTSFTVNYTVEHGKIKEGDYITVKVPDSLKNIDLQLDPKHFKGYEKQSDGSYRLIFTNNANGIAGSLSINATASNETTSSKEATVEVNGSKSTITIAGLTPSGTGVEKAIEKSAYDGKEIHHGGYDYSTGTGKDATEIGIYTPSKDVVAHFHIDVNHNKKDITNVTVTDLVPVTDGVAYNNDLKIENANGITYENRSQGNHINVYFEKLSYYQEPRLTYSITIKAGTKLKITNNAVMDYTTTTGQKETVIDTFKLKPGNGYSAADAYKTVDKTSVSSNPNDQIVKYTITFDPDETFEAGKLMMPDKLHKDVTFLYAYGDSAFEITYDKTTHTVNIVNKEKVDGSRKRTVTIVTDFSNVPEGTDVTNTVGNTVHTLKYKGELTLTAKKTVNGQTPRADEVFKFQLTDQSGAVLQEVENTANGSIRFKPIQFKKEDLNREHVYLIKESSDVTGYKKDTTIYTVKVTPTDTDNDGIMEINPVITKGDDNPVTNMIFNNEYIPSEAKASLEVTKKLTGRELKADEFEFTLTDQDGNVKETVKNDKDGNVKFSELEFDKAG
ncbi:Spy0128 family protein, partial [Streptococcus oralis]|uniref:Spy0128 family protein n=1 Tax=Streptococcus oralis TaxID=1303 RepID=UPI0009BE547D